MTTQDYKSDKCAVAYLSELSSANAEALVGKHVSRVEAKEYSLILHFDDGSMLTVQGAMRDGCALGINFEPGPRVV